MKTDLSTIAIDALLQKRKRSHRIEITRDRSTRARITPSNLAAILFYIPPT